MEKFSTVMKKCSLILILCTLTLTACQIFVKGSPTPTLLLPTPTPSPKVLNVCLGYEPESLYIYNSASKASKVVMSAIYDGPIDFLNAKHEAVILSALPSFNDGSARFTPTEVKTGDLVVNTEGYLVSLKKGESIFPAGCTSPTCAIIYDGASPIQMNQISALFKIKPSITWSDGEPLSSADSIFSFRVASDPATPVSKRYVDHTFSYKAVDHLTIEWISRPGLVTDAFENYFWVPLPEHAWSALTAQQMLFDESVNRKPLSWGPYMVSQWVTGQRIQLIKNPFYFRANEGLPHYDILNFEITNPSNFESMRQLADMHCDIVSDTVLNTKILNSDNVENYGYQMVANEPNRLVMLAFGIVPSSYDDSYYPYGGDRPDFFGDVRVRQALAHCIDRQSIADKLLLSKATVLKGYLRNGQAESKNASIWPYPYDPTTAISLLEAAGWRDLDQNSETPIVHMGNARIPAGTPFSVSLLVSEGELMNDIAAEISDDLAACGIEARVEQKPTADLFLPGAEGEVFGRKFDLALLDWQTSGDFICEFFQSTEIPSSNNEWLGETTGGANFFGYVNSEFDRHCETYKKAGLDKTIKADAFQAMQQILMDELPFVPLFYFSEFTLISDNLCISEDINNEATLFSHLEKIYECQKDQ